MRTKTGRLNYIVIVPLILVLVAMVAQSCNSSKKCGCGHDLNGVYKYKHRRNWR